MAAEDVEDSEDSEDSVLGQLGNYRLLELLGEGGMGAVYRAVHTKLGRTVAIKVLQKDLTSDRGIINRFFHEARAANTIRHDHVIEVYDFVEKGEDVYFVMEYLKGHDLHDAVHRGGATRPMDPPRTAAILEQIASALYATHARNIVHRDLKPENVFLTDRDGVSDFVKIFDFGIAKLDRPDGRMTVEGSVLGTPEYMSPEQARGVAVDGRSDLYSLGCIAYEMLTRHQVFGGGGQTDILTRQINVAPPPMNRFVANVPPALESVVMRTLAKDPGQRPQTALAFAEEIAQAMGRNLEDSSWYHSWGQGRATTPSKVMTPSKVPTPPALVLRSTARRTGWKAIALGTVIATVLTAAVVMGKRQPASSAAEVARGAPAPRAAAPASVAVQAVTVVLQSTPSGAEIVDQLGQRIGVTPFDLVVNQGNEQQLGFRKAGFQPVQRRFTPRTDTTISVHLDPELQRAARGREAKRHRSPRSPLDSMARTIDPFAE
ncbi:MAG TPA: serine/threonine-protein kinase [Polyangia bacterium]|jgi:serine/threonine-protein kinase|nr:serine/threonine-protein kinase [Polyangia bacterium]